MLTAQIMRNFRIVRDWADAGYFETDSLRQLRDDVTGAIHAGRLVAICGPVGSGKTMMMNRLQHDIAAGKDIIVARSLSVDKPRVALPNLVMALFLDISGDPNLKAPTPSLSVASGSCRRSCARPGNRSCCSSTRPTTSTATRSMA